MSIAAQRAHGWSVTSLRFFTVYGPRQRRDLAIAKFVERIARDQAIELYGTGESVRDYTYVDDIVDGVVAAVDQLQLKATPARYRLYNLCGGRAIDLRQLVERLSAAVGQAAKVVYLPEQPGDLPATLGDLTRSARELGYAPRVSLDEGLRRFVSWWLAKERRARREGRALLSVSSPLA
jgi:UDP-glucuronate 4-epimerase